jgi:hypothetical protein
MNYSHRFFLYGPVGLLAIVMLAVVTFWWTESSAFSRRLDAANGHEIAPGIHFSFAKKTMSGFPFRVDSELDGLRIAIDTSHGPAVWTAERFALHSLTYGRTQFVFEAAGNQHIEWHRDNGQLHTYDFLPGSLRASAIMIGGRLARFDLDALNVDSPDIAVSEVQLHLRENPKIDGLDLFVTANNVHFTPNEQPAFGPDMKHFAVNAMVSPGSSFDGFLSGHGGWRDNATNWHARHGGLLVNAVEVNWGALDAVGKGALAVDDLHRPIGELRFAIDDGQALLKKLSVAEKSGQSDKGLAQSLLADVSTTHADLSKPLSVNLGFKDGVAYVGMTPADLLSPLF